MESNYLKCTFCARDFDLKKRIPHIIIACGHSICQYCLLQQLVLKTSFTCPEDMTLIRMNGKSVHDFPKNHALIKMLDDKNMSKSPVKNENRNSLAVYKDLSERITKTTTSNTNRPQSEKVLLSHKLSLTGQKNLPNKQYITNDSNSYSEENIEDVCVKHHKRLEVICTEPECQTKVCYQCGLFGEHKGHNVEPEHDFFNRADQIADKLSSTLESVQKREAYAFNKFIRKIVKSAIENKKEEMRRKISKSFEVN